MSEAKNVNYTTEQTQELVGRYTAGMPVEMIAREMSRTVRSVVAKLSREGVYVAKAKTASSRPTKEDLVARIETGMGFEAGVLDSLSKCSRDQLVLIASRF
jgi:FKBP-type peptidyl-prolyl cis-trans isomerase (trigger factor)